MNLRQAVIDLIKYSLVYLIDTGDRGLNAAIVLVLALLIEWAVSVIEPYLALWKKYQYERYIATLPDGRLSLDTISILMNNHSIYIQTVPYQWLMAPDNIMTNVEISKHFENLLSYYDLLGSTDMVKEFDDYIRSRLRLSQFTKQVLIPVYKFNSEIIYLRIRSGLHIGNLALAMDSQTRETVDRILQAILDTAMDDIVGVHVLSVRPQMGPKQISLAIALRTELAPNDCFIHRDRERIKQQLIAFNSNADNKYLVKTPRANFGIILWGNPGCGKTTFVSWLCSLLGRSCVDIKLGDPGWTASDLQQLLTNPESIIRKRIDELVYFIDEFDLSGECISREISSSDQSASGTSSILENITINNAETLREVRKVDLETRDRITLSTLLTTFDGIHRVTGRIIIACTNYIDRIDAALLRPGRLGDLQIKLTDFGPVEISQAFELYKEVPADAAERISRITEPVAPAGLISMINTKSPEEVLTSLGV